MAKEQFPREVTFTVDILSEGNRYSGRFVARRPSMRDQLRIEGETSKLTGGLYYDENNPGRGITPSMYHFAQMMAFLKVCLTEAPDWWNDDDVFDMVVVAQVYNEAQAVDPFRSRTDTDKGKPPKDVGVAGENRDHEHNDPNVPDRVADMVSTKV